MSYSIRYQVFVSSTFNDLTAERAEVIQAIWELDGIPTGMEAFVASNESQWDVIKRVIDECDYYILLIGGRYGSLAPEGLSYTEKEFRYARAIGVPILAFVHGDPDSIPVGKTERNEISRGKLDEFRAEIMKNYPVRAWSTAAELGGLVSRSLVREIKVAPRPGWIRNDGSSPVSLLERINNLDQENRDLRSKLETESTETPDDLESGDDVIKIEGYRKQYNRNTRLYSRSEWSAKVSWSRLFRDLGPALLNEATEETLKQLVTRFGGWDVPPDGIVTTDETVSIESWNEILIQLRALGFIDKGTKKRGVNDKSSYWRITPKGDRALVNLLARRRSKSGL